VSRYKGRPGLGRYKHPLELGLFVEVPLLFIGLVAWFVARGKGSGDFKIFRGAGASVMHGHSPYVAPTAHLLAQNNHFVYPTPFALPFVPFALIPEPVGAVIFMLLSAGAIVAALRLLGLTDWRCYGLVFLSAPALDGLFLGSIGAFLLLLVAAGWHFRNRALAGVLLAVAAAAKVFLWPVLIWLIATRRLRGAAAAAGTLVVIVGIWSLIDLGGLRRYPETVRVLNDVQRWKSYSPQTLAISLGVPTATAVAATIGLAAAGVMVIILLGRDARDDGRRAFAGATLVAIIATPILWVHYLVLLLVPLSLLRPRLSPLWLVPLFLWVTPHPESLGIIWRIVFVLAAVAATATALIEKRPRRFRSRVALGTRSAPDSI
jgi:alpha-1,2-mannosyltransferase